MFTLFPNISISLEQTTVSKTDIIEKLTYGPLPSMKMEDSRRMGYYQGQ